MGLCEGRRRSYARERKKKVNEGSRGSENGKSSMIVNRERKRRKRINEGI